jgi:group II intron reverse transcriptase/maturase
MHRAWRAVRANGGGAGTDGVDIRAFEVHLETELAVLARELSDGGYVPRGVRRILIPKRNEGLRPLAIWTLRDRVAQRAVYEAIEPRFEPGFLACSHGFRPGRSVQTAIADIVAGRNQGLRWVVDADIKDCFDSIAPDLLLAMVRQQLKDPTLLHALESWLQAGVLTATGAIRPAGTAQGGVLSPLLCNVYLHQFDVEITGQALHLVRYADDLVVLCRRRAEAQAAQQSVATALKRLRLQLNPHKTRLVSFDDGFKFLGVFFLRNEHFNLS